MGNKSKITFRGDIIVRLIMIGQVKLLTNIEKILGKFPRFSIITGPKGSGKRTLCKEIVRKLKLSYVPVGNKIDDIRSAIDTAYTQFDPMGFVISNADSMSIAAKNSLLKITEEPPRNSYFFMTLENIDSTLPTIRSRGTTFVLDPYTKEELINYRKYKGYSEGFDDTIKSFCQTTGDVDELFGYNVKEFTEFVNNVVNNIQVPKSGNAFKIVGKLKIKDTDKGFDVPIFLKACQQSFLDKGKQLNNKSYVAASIATLETLRQLNYKTVSRLGLVDMWIINVRSKLQDV